MNDHQTVFEPDRAAPAATALESLRALLPILAERGAVADSAAAIDEQAWESLRGCGLLAAPLPVPSGGAGLLEPGSVRDLVDVLRLLGAADLSLARLFEGHANAIGLVERYGDRAQMEVLAASVREGALSAVWGADDARRLEADVAGAGLRLRGRKVFASGAGRVTRPLVTAATPDGPILLLLRLAPGERADASGWTAQGMRASATGIVDLDGLIVGPEAVVGRPGDFLRQPYLSGGSWRFCAAHLGASERLLDLLREHLVSRQRGDDPFQLQRVAACAAAVGTAAFWIGSAARRLAEGTESADDVAAFANLTRMVTERAALDVMEAVHRGVGLGGFLRPHPIERISRDLATYLRQPVPDLAMADAGRAVLASQRPTRDLWAAR